MENLLITLFPTKCQFCNKNMGAICYECILKARPVYQYFCIICEKPSIEGKTHSLCHKQGCPSSIFSPFKYSGVIRQCIKKAKYSSRLFFPLKRFTREGMKLFSKSGISYEEHLVVPIPLSYRKYKERGFNQAEIIAEAVAKELKLNYTTRALYRSRDTTAQHANSRAERYKNLENAFIVKNPIIVAGKKILLVDDICTSGATFLTAAECLYKAGAVDVACFSLAKKFLKNRHLLGDL